jgi:transcriptional regulator with XRE-family HTH domain
VPAATISRPAAAPPPVKFATAQDTRPTVHVNDTGTATASRTGVRAARKRARLTQTQVAERLNIPLITYRRWDRGTHRPRDPEQLQHLAEVLNAPLDELYPPDNNPHVHAARAAHTEPRPGTPRPAAVVAPAGPPIPDPREVHETLYPTTPARHVRATRRLLAALALAAALAIAGAVTLLTTGSHPSPRPAPADVSVPDTAFSSVASGTTPAKTQALARRDRRPTKNHAKRSHHKAPSHRHNRAATKRASSATSTPTAATRDASASAAANPVTSGASPPATPAPTRSATSQPASAGNASGCSDFAALC